MRRAPWLLSVWLMGMLATTAGCHHGHEKRSQTFRVLCTTYPVWLFTRAVVGSEPGMDVALLVPADAGCPHEFVMRPEDVRRLARSDVLVMNGLGLDAFAEDQFRKLRRTAPVIVATEGIADLLPSAAAGAPEHHHGAGYRDNPHLFASPFQAAHMVRIIAQGLGHVRPSAAVRFRSRAERWAADLRRCGDELRQVVASLRTRSVITQHDVFDYLARDTGLRIVGVITARPGEDPSAAEVLSLIQRARAEHAGAVFTEPQYSARVGETIARQAGITHATLDPVATGPEDAGMDYYVKTMRKNAATLRRVLGKRS